MRLSYNSGDPKHNIVIDVCYKIFYFFKIFFQFPVRDPPPQISLGVENIRGIDEYRDSACGELF